MARSAPGEGPCDSDQATAGSSVARSAPGERPSNADRATETAGPSGARSAPSEEPSNARAAALRATLQASMAVSNQPQSSGPEPTVARSEPGEARDSGETEPSLDAVTWSDGARTLLPIIQQLLSDGMPALYEQLGRLDCLGAAASMRHVREQGAHTKPHDTVHRPVGGGSAELAIGNWMLGRNDDAAGSFVESWIVTLRQAGDANSRSLLEEFVRFGELAHRLVQPLCQVKQIYDLLDWRKGRRFCLSLLDQLASPSFAGPASSDSALAVARSAPGKEEEEVQGHWGTKQESELLEVLAKTARALGEVAAEAPNAVAVAVSPGTLEAEVGIEEPDWSGDETPDIPVTIAKTEEDEEMPAAGETAASEAPKRPKRVVLATGQLALLRALAAANASNWADIQRTLKETPGDAEDKEDLVNNLTDLAATFAKNRAECSKAASRGRKLSILRLSLRTLWSWNARTQSDPASPHTWVG